MVNEFINILLIEDNHSDIRIIRTMLKDAGHGLFKMSEADNLAAGLEYLKSDNFDIVLLDLGLPDSTGLETLKRVQAAEPDIPIVIMTVSDSDEQALEAVKNGAQDYLVKGKVDSYIFIRSIRYAIERQRMFMVLRGMVLLDELTGLYNRRGFFALAKQQIRLADRSGRKLLLGIADLDGLKAVNDSFGHSQGDSALKETVEVLKDTFRGTDVIARIGGDEFAVIAIEADKDAAKTLKDRLERNVQKVNSQKGRNFSLSISMGIAHYDPEHSCSVDDLIHQADKLMYTEKTKK